MWNTDHAGFTITESDFQMLDGQTEAPIIDKWRCLANVMEPKLLKGGKTKAGKSLTHDVTFLMSDKRYHEFEVWDVGGRADIKPEIKKNDSSKRNVVSDCIKRLRLYLIPSQQID